MTATSEPRDGVVVVGVDGSSATEAAVAYGAREAHRLCSDLRILHVVPPPPDRSVPGLVGPSDSDPDLRRRRDQMLEHAATLGRSVLPAGRVSTDIVTGARVPALLAAAEQARIVVLGAPWHARIDRVITGSVVGSVASRSPVPVVGVPEDWAAARERGRVVVGVKRPEDPASERLVARAIGIAASRGARLTVLHAWEFPVIYDNMVATTFEEQAWVDVKRGLLEELVGRARGPHREVPVDLQVRHGQGAHTLIDTSAGADLLVISRRRRAFPFGHLGAPGRAVLRESRCPVMVLPPAAADEPASDVTSTD